MPRKFAFPSTRGSYILILHLAKTGTVRVGRLGNIDFQKGFYAYVGSAMGPGGLAGRIRHHLKPAKNPHWHIDYLGQIADIKEVWICEGPHRREHAWARIFSGSEKAGIPAKGFGSSDCHCLTHLFHMKKRPVFHHFKEALAGQNMPVCLLKAVPVTKGEKI